MSIHVSIINTIPPSPSPSPPPHQPTPIKIYPFCSQLKSVLLFVSGQTFVRFLKKGKTFIRFKDNANQVFNTNNCFFCFFLGGGDFIFFNTSELLFPQTPRFSSRKWTHVDLRVDNIKTHDVSLVSRRHVTPDTWTEGGGGNSSCKSVFLKHKEQTDFWLVSHKVIIKPS